MNISPGVQTKCDELIEEIRIISSHLAELKAETEPDNLIAQHFLARLHITTENASGCVVLARNNLTVPLLTLTRSIFESFITTYWASLTESNAQLMIESSGREMARLVRNILSSRRGAVWDRTSGLEVTDRVLASAEIKEARRPPRFDVMAEQAAIKNIYDAVYGFLSMFAHGTATDLIANMEREEPTFGALEASLALLKALHLIVTKHVRKRCSVSHEEIERILNVMLTT